MTTIAISEETKKGLLKIVSELQIKYGRKVNYDEAIKYMLANFKKKHPNLLREVCNERSGAEERLEELYMERKKDEERSERYIRD